MTEMQLGLGRDPELEPKRVKTLFVSICIHIAIFAFLLLNPDLLVQMPKRTIRIAGQDYDLRFGARAGGPHDAAKKRQNERATHASSLVSWVRFPSGMLPRKFQPRNCSPGARAWAPPAVPHRHAEE